MRRTLIILVALYLVAATISVETPAREVIPAFVPFKVGERLTYSIRYGFARAGTATLAVTDILDCGQGKCYRVVSEARSTMPFSLFFEVQDSVISMMDVESLSTLRYEKRLKEGNYTKNEVIVFDQENHTATYPDSSVIPVPPDVQDVLTSLYYLRTRSLEVGRTFLIENHADKKNYPLEVKILRSETVSVPAGRFECFVVEPILKASGLFQHQGRLTVWLTKDSRLMPVMMTGKIIVGSVSAVLSEIEPGE